MSTSEVDLLPSILAHYALGTVLNVRDSSHGFVNRNLKLETTTGEYLLRYYSYSSPEDIQREVALLTKLATEGFPVAPPIARLDGTYLNQEPEGYSVLFQFVEGDIPRLNPITVAQIAQTVAKLNRLTVWSAVEKPYYCTTTYCQNLLDQFTAADFQYPDLFAFYREEYLTLEPRLQQPVPRGLIHGDVFPDNTIFQGNQLKAIVDFDEFGIGPLLTEIGTAVNGFCFIKEQFQEDLFTVFLKNYESIRPLEAPERKLLPFYLRWGAFVFVSWHLAELLRRRNERQLERVYQFVNRIRYFRNRYSGLEL